MPALPANRWSPQDEEVTAVGQKNAGKTATLSFIQGLTGKILRQQMIQEDSCITFISVYPGFYPVIPFFLPPSPTGCAWGADTRAFSYTYTPLQFAPKTFQGRWQTRSTRGAPPRLFQTEASDTESGVLPIQQRFLWPFSSHLFLYLCKCV